MGIPEIRIRLDQYRPISNMVSVRIPMTLMERLRILFLGIVRVRVIYHPGEK